MYGKQSMRVLDGCSTRLMVHRTNPSRSSSTSRHTILSPKCLNYNRFGLNLESNCQPIAYNNTMKWLYRPVLNHHIIMAPRFVFACLPYWYLPPRGRAFERPLVPMFRKMKLPHGGPAVARPPRSRRRSSWMDRKNPPLSRHAWIPCRWIRVSCMHHLDKWSRT